METVTIPAAYVFSYRKRIFDLLVGSIGAAVGLIVLPFAFLLVVLTSSGSPIYLSKRLGRNCVPFKVFKVRTMYLGSDRDVYRFVRVDDERVTPIGKLLRSTYIDELPQFLNVLKGDMSIVGPRPEIAELVERQGAIDTRFRERNIAKPGITGLAQISMPHADDAKMAALRVNYDIKYIQTASLVADLRIVGATVARMFKREGH